MQNGLAPSFGVVGVSALCWQETEIFKPKDKWHGLAFLPRPSSAISAACWDGVVPWRPCCGERRGCRRTRSAPCARPCRKGAFLGAPSTSPKIPEMCYVQQKVLTIERLSGPSACWFCRTLQLVDLFVCLQPGNLSVLKTLRVPFFTRFTVTVVGSEACNPGKKNSAKIPHQRFN